MSARASPFPLETRLGIGLWWAGGLRGCTRCIRPQTRTLVGVTFSGAQAKSALGDAPCLAWELLATELLGPGRHRDSMDWSWCVLMHKHGPAGFVFVLLCFGPCERVSFYKADFTEQ